jgi:eukaryotic-like serine/threonine-protein kinase
VGFFLEPEFALAVLSGRNPPLLSMAGEQYAVAVMLYFVFTGSHYLEFSLERDKMLSQIAQNHVLPFAHRHTQPWPEIENLLKKALSKNPAERFSSLREFYDALRSVKALPAAPMPVREPDPKLEEMKTALFEKLGLTGPLLTGGPLPGPAVSVNYGAAGVAYALYRMACATEEAELLALADAWCAKSMREIGDELAFYNDKYDITPETVGSTSLYHSAAGVYLVQALIAQARGDFLSQQLATSKFVDVSAQPGDKLDVTLGRAGTLLACSFLLQAQPTLKLPERFEPPDGLRSLGHEIAEQLWRTVEGYAPIRESKELSNLGVAHGWAGLLYALLCWCAVSQDPLPLNLGERLSQLGECAQPVGRGLRWPWDLTRTIAEPAGYMPGWCNGSTGYVFLWTQAHKMLGEAEYLAKAEGAAWDAWKTPSQIGNLCCGMAGQGYALLRLYRHTGDAAWLGRAQTTMHRAATVAHDARSRPDYEQLARRPESLYKGDLGILVLAADLECPEHACMPLFEPEA